MYDVITMDCKSKEELFRPFFVELLSDWSLTPARLNQCIVVLDACVTPFDPKSEICPLRNFMLNVIKSLLLLFFPANDT